MRYRSKRKDFDDGQNLCSFQCSDYRRGERNKTHRLDISFRYTGKISGKIPLSDYRARERRYIFHKMLHFKVLPTRVPHGVPYRTDCRIGYSEHPFRSPF